MSASVNRVTLIGNLGKDPIVRFTQSGTPVANFSLATSRKFQDKPEETTWHSITVWGKTAELCGQYLAKGKMAYVEGRINNREWQNGEGQRVKENEIIAERVIFLSPRGETVRDAIVEDSDFESRGAPQLSGGGVLDADDIPFAP